MLCLGELNPRDNGRELSQREEEVKEKGEEEKKEEATIDSLDRRPSSVGCVTTYRTDRRL